MATLENNPQFAKVAAEYAVADGHREAARVLLWSAWSLYKDPKERDAERIAYRAGLLDEGDQFLAEMSQEELGTYVDLQQSGAMHISRESAQEAESMAVDTYLGHLAHTRPNLITEFGGTVNLYNGRTTLPPKK